MLKYQGLCYGPNASFQSHLLDLTSETAHHFCEHMLDFSTSDIHFLEYFSHISTSFNISPMKCYPIAHLLAYKYLLKTYHLPNRVEADERHTPFFQGAPSLWGVTQNNCGAKNKL